MGVKELRGKLVLVTGAGSGIGQAIALAFARAGARLAITDVVEDRLLPVFRQISDLGHQPIAQAVDVADEAAMLRLAETIHDEAGPLDVLVNNAGIGYLGSLVDTTAAAWRRVLDVNVVGVANGCRAFVPYMVVAGGPRRVVNVASAAAFAPLANMSAYAASKSAVIGLSDVLAMELAVTDVGVTAVCPGIINTAIVAGRANVADAIRDEQLTRLQAYYTKHGVKPDVVAAEVVHGVRRGRSLVLVGPKARPSYHAKRISRAMTARLAIASSREIGFI